MPCSVPAKQYFNETYSSAVVWEVLIVYYYFPFFFYDTIPSRWRGDGTFSEHPYNEVDGLALAMLSYTRFTNIIPPPYIDAEAIKKAKGTDAPETIPEENRKLSDIEWYEEPIPDDSDFLVPDPDDVNVMLHNPYLPSRPLSRAVRTFPRFRGNCPEPCRRN